MQFRQVVSADKVSAEKTILLDNKASITPVQHLATPPKQNPGKKNSPNIPSSM